MQRVHVSTNPTRFERERGEKCFIYLPPVGESQAAYAVANIAKNTKAVFMFELILIVCVCFSVFSFIFLSVSVCLVGVLVQV